MQDFAIIARRVRAAVTIAVTLIMVYALYVSRDHITHVALWLGIPGWQAETAFILVDLPALIGRTLQLKYFAPETIQVGRRLTYLSGTLSLACNVGSGIIHRSYGAAGWGAFVVVMFVILEGTLTKIKPATMTTVDIVSEVSEMAADDAASPALPEAPVSPATVRGPYGPRNGQEYSKRHARRLAANGH